MSSIITFYSYKGGVGRSMALANIAVLLAQRGLNVLVVDWDLEAPGLERYFSGYCEFKPIGKGLLPLLIDAAAGKEPKYKSFLWEIHIEDSQKISFLPSGREIVSDYSGNLEKFDWQVFFKDKGGGVLLRICVLLGIKTMILS